MGARADRTEREKSALREALQHSREEKKARDGGERRDERPGDAEQLAEDRNRRQ